MPKPKRQATTRKSRTRKEPIKLNKPKQRILAALAKAGKPVTRKQLAALGVEPTSFGAHAGLLDPERRAAVETKIGPSLLTLGLVKCEQHDVDGKDTILWSITKQGKAALPK